MTAPRLCSDCGASAVAFRAGTDEVREQFLLAAAQFLCTACMSYRHPPPRCGHDPSTPCARCGQPRGYVVERQRDTRVCWRCDEAGE